jgi:excinuclease UvrABC nuclease subunit
MYTLYFLMQGDLIVYIGCTKNLANRLQAHKYTKEHDSVRTIKVNKRKDAYKYEARWIRKFKPMYNLGSDSSGRKPVSPEEKVILVGFYIKRKIVESVGGISKAREIAHQAVATYDER